MSRTMERESMAPALAPELAPVRASLDKYQDVTVALRDGYLSTVGCIDYPKGAKEGAVDFPPGAMGVHFLNMANVGPKLDPMKPQILIYEPVNGKLKLAAAEWFVPVQVAGGKAPTLFGQTFAGPMEGHYPVMPKSLRHYDLHVWLWKPNPKGVFTPTNTALKCPAGDPYTYTEGGDAHHHM
ncbi:MAG TPA: hypothetical protein VF461_24240 [Gemmatimonadaceae bacterium]